MADEIRITINFSVIKNNLNHQARPNTFSDDLVGDAKGPTPGAIAVSTDGVDVDLSQLTTPGWCRISNIEDDGGNYFEWGLWDPGASIFRPVGECAPGQQAIYKFSRNFGEQYTGVGTGTSAPIDTLRLKANTAAVRALVEVFEA